MLDLNTTTGQTHAINKLNAVPMPVKIKPMRISFKARANRASLSYFS